MYDTSQYAQRIVSSQGKRDGLAWQLDDGSWGGPVGEKIARAIQQGYSSGAQPYHGYFFRILKGQGPAAHLGELDFVVKGRMIGGFALVAAPAEYGVTGVKTFIVSHEGVVYERDFGTNTLAEFRKMERYNPDMNWKPVNETGLIENRAPADRVADRDPSRPRATRLAHAQRDGADRRLAADIRRQAIERAVFHGIDAIVNAPTLEREAAVQRLTRDREGYRRFARAARCR